jgi:ATP-binding cassette subfamily B (MDR/TAP) protein 1
VGFIYTGEHVTQKLREQYLAAVLRQNIALFDNLGAGEITTTISANMDLVLLGVCEKLAITITALTTFVCAMIVGFTKNWRLSFVLLSIVFAVLFVMGGFSTFLIRFSKLSHDAYVPGASTAEEAFASVRTVTAFNGQEKLATKYERSLADTMRWGLKNKMAIGCMIASMMLVTYLAYALGFWEGSRLLVAGHANLSETLTVLLSLLLGAVSIANAAPHIQAFAGAVSAASNIFKIIDRPLPDDEGHQSFIPDSVRGALEFRDVKHIYPSRPEVTVLQDFNLVIPAGKVTALVGASGCGKSTIVGLVERFYTPVGGQVRLDGHDIQTLDLKWLRRQMSLVSQEPILFNCSIRTNIEHGLIGTDLETVEEEKKAELVSQAAKMANAHDFITSLPQGYNTIAGDRGLALSGGQKQRIAIARAIISNPKILLLDEATSALDSQSEGVVQNALDVAAQGRTTIVIAHRLSTIQGADNIVVLENGRIVEQGTHLELLSRKTAYYNLVEAQQLTSEKKGLSPAINLDSYVPHHAHRIHQDTLNGELGKGDVELQQTSLPSSVEQRRSSGDSNNRDSLWTIVKLIASFNKEETGVMLFGLLCSMLAGGGMPVQGVIFAKCIISLSLPSTHYSQLRSDINYWCLIYLVVALAVFIVSAGHGVAFAYCSERLYVL